jgi:hypothetical protein
VSTLPADCTAKLESQVSGKLVPGLYGDEPLPNMSQALPRCRLEQAHPEQSSDDEADEKDSDQ